MDVQSLPNDLDELKQLLLNVITNQEDYAQNLKRRDAVIENQAKRIEILEAELDVEPLPATEGDNSITVAEHTRKRRGNGSKNRCRRSMWFMI